MNFGNIGLSGFLLIMVILLIFWGPSKLPEIGKSFGRSIKEFKNATSGLLDEHPTVVANKSNITEVASLDNTVKEDTKA
jgi:sec-independent protein translocase protein TatA